eukprot:365060-Chlamydomonas_euryale.AAC.1
MQPHTPRARPPAALQSGGLCAATTRAPRRGSRRVHRDEAAEYLSQEWPMRVIALVEALVPTASLHNGSGDTDAAATALGGGDGVGVGSAEAAAAYVEEVMAALPPRAAAAGSGLLAQGPSISQAQVRFLVQQIVGDIGSTGAA